MKIIKFFLKILSRAIYNIIPIEFKKKTMRSELERELYKNLKNETINQFKEDFKKSVIFNSNYRSTIREYSIKNSISNDKKSDYYYLEFGVFKGESANYFSKFVNKIYCFDSFEGFNEDWIGTSTIKSQLNQNKKIPKLNSNVEVVAGWVEETLDDFLQKHNPKINFVHMDLDVYSSTKFVLSKLKPYLVKGAIILFDQLYNYIGWEYGEYKALKEVFENNEFKYRAFNLNGKQCVIQIN